MTISGSRVLDLQLHLLDRQVVDADGRMICKVDDLELAVDETGGLYVAAILFGPRALGPRLGGRLGRWMTSIGQRLGTGDKLQPPSINFALITDIGSSVTVSHSRKELAVDPVELWVDRYIISRIPGSGHESK
jgi:sporulation protein YlmC with PRC-barrel domain